ncbi:MAG: transporter [Syntrophales bacterium]|jgi:hypothetical protein
MKTLKMLFIVLSMLTILPGTIYSAVVTDEVGDHIPGPPGLSAVVFYYDHITGTNQYSGGTLVNRNTNLTADVTALRFLHFSEIGGFPVAMALALPYGNVSINGAGVGGNQFSSTEIGDLMAISGIWLIAKPEQRMWLDISAWLTAPTGEYTPEKPLALNLGQNMWSGKLLMGFTKGFGPITWDLNSFVQIFTNNDRYVQFGPPNASGPATLKRDPVYEVETHLKYDLTKALFVSADYYYLCGGETKTDEFGSNNDRLNDHTAGITVGIQLTPKTQLLVHARDTFKTENQIETMDIGARLAYFF